MKIAEKFVTAHRPMIAGGGFAGGPVIHELSGRIYCSSCGSRFEEGEIGMWRL
jgi:hypothetical protein